MSIQDSGRRSPTYTGTGQVREFAFCFKVFAEDQVAVYRKAPDDITEELVPESEYSVSLEETGGTVTMNTPPDKGVKLVIVSNIPYTQLLGLQNFGSFAPEDMNAAWDKNTGLIQQVRDGMDRAVKVPVISETNPDDLVGEILTVGEAVGPVVPVLDDIKTVAGIAPEVVKTAGMDSDIKTVSGIATEIKKTVEMAADVSAVGKNIGAVVNVSNNLDEIIGTGGAVEAAKEAAESADRAEAAAEAAVGQLHAVSYEEQELSTSERMQARANIGADYFVNVKDFGAKGDGVADNTEAFISAANNGEFVSPDGVFSCRPPENRVVTMLNALQLMRDSVSVDIALPAGVFNLTRAIILTGRHNVKIHGVTTELNLTSCTGVESGSTRVEVYANDFRDVKWHRVKYQTDSASAVAVGDLIGIAHEESSAPHTGLFEVVAVDGSSVTVLCTNQTPPAVGPVNATATVFKTVLKATEGSTTFLCQRCTGIKVEGCALVGSASLVEMPDGRGPQNIDAVGRTGVTGFISRDGSECELRNFAVYGFSGSNIFSGDNGQLNLYDGFVSMSSRQGIGAASSSMTNCSNVVSSGNVLDGAVAQNSAVLFGSLVTTGNFRHGVIVSGTSIGNFSSLYTGFNSDSGLVSTGSSTLLCSRTTAVDNGAKGIWSYANGIVVAVGAEVHNNAVGVRADTNGAVNCGSATFTKNSEDVRAKMGGRVFAVGSNVRKATPLVNTITPDLSVVQTASSASSISFCSNGATLAARITSANQVLLGRGTVFPDVNARLHVEGSTAQSGNAYPSVDGGASIGNASLRWAQVYATTGTINTSDAREKTAVADPDEAVMRAWSRVRTRVFQFKDSVEKKTSENARLHVGVIAQEVVEAFAAEGLDATRYGLLCYDKWDDLYEDEVVVDAPEVFDDEGRVITPERTHVEHRLVMPAGDRYGIRYEEALALECAYLRHRMDALEGRLSSLENGTKP